MCGQMLGSLPLPKNPNDLDAPNAYTSLTLQTLHSFQRHRTVHLHGSTSSRGHHHRFGDTAQRILVFPNFGKTVPHV
jgi:hypothetical protein